MKRKEKKEHTLVKGLYRRIHLQRYDKAFTQMIVGSFDCFRVRATHYALIGSVWTVSVHEQKDLQFILQKIIKAKVKNIQYI